jgi:hypothetical protein
LIDWGLAEFYFPEKEYNVRVASRQVDRLWHSVALVIYDEKRTKFPV